MALFADGSAKVFYGNEYSSEELLAMGTVNTLSFGPVLLQNGEIGEQVANGYYSSNEPRCALGIIEPGYFLLLTIEGRHKGSEGENLRWVAARMQALGVQEALNLDGGNTTALVFRGQLLNKIGTFKGNNYVAYGCPDCIKHYGNRSARKPCNIRRVTYSTQTTAILGNHRSIL